MVTIYACTLDDPATVTPTFHSFTAEQMPWLEIADDLPRYEYGSLARDATPVSYGPRHPKRSSKPHRRARR
jgi:hypothetical protein